MRWGATILAVVAMAMLAGCGGGGSDPGAVVEAASIHQEKVEGEYLLAKVELDQAVLEQDQAAESGKPNYAEKATRDVMRAARHIEHECHEGDGLESCTEIEPIEAIVKEMTEEIGVH
jgi:hypothetical protein